MRLNRKKLIIFAACLVASLSALLLLNQIIAESNQLPNGVMFSSRYGINLSFEDCGADEMTPVISGEITADSFVSNELSMTGYPVPAKLVYTNESYSQIVPLRLIYGGYFVQSPIREANRYIVISDSLSLDMFKTYDSVGHKLTVGKDEYTVCGVYKKETSLLNRISSDGIERVYLSYSNFNNYEKTSINRFYIKNNEGMFEESLIGTAQLPQNSPIYYENAVNFGDMKRIVIQLRSVAFFALGINIIAFLAFLFTNAGKSLYSYIRKGDYDKKETLLRTLPLVGFGAGAALIFWLVKFQLYIPTKMMPPDNIFDLSFYIENIVTAIQQQNTLNMYSFYWNYSVSLIISAALASIVLTVLLLVTWWYGVKAGFEHEKQRVKK